ncbi:MAG: hypothetical protein ACYS47_11640 [Planctomycetota bacterium]|jgi:hypothetical protein
MRRPPTILLCLVLAPGFLVTFPAQAEDSTTLYDLSFTPKRGKTYTVEYENDKTWDYPQHKMKGTLKTCLKIHLKILPPAYDGKDSGKAKGDFLSVTYAGEGTKKGKPFKHDIHWDARRGYVRGKNDEANKSWVRDEIRAGLIMLYDERGMVLPGSG